MAEKVSVYRERGSDPPGTKVGGLALGVVHHGIDAKFAAELKKKRFRIVDRHFDPSKDAAKNETKSDPPALPANAAGGEQK